MDTSQLIILELIKVFQNNFITLPASYDVNIFVLLLNKHLWSVLLIKFILKFIIVRKNQIVHFWHLSV